MNVELNITGIGLWAPGLTNWAAFTTAAKDNYANVGTAWEKPAPTIIPGRERRRAPLIVRLAVEVMEQACRMATVDRASVASVFASAMGDAEITDYMCSILAGKQKLLSPTKFHNSVHNAPAGYWSISTQNRSASTFVSGFENSFAAALFEAAMICVTDNVPVALAAYDIASTPPLTDVCPIDQPFGCALVLEPAGAKTGWLVAISHAAGPATALDDEPAFIRERVAHNPAARCLPLLDLLARRRTDELRWPTGSVTRIGVRLIAGPDA